MNKIILAISAVFLINSTMAQAEVETFNFTYSGASRSNTANASGSITLDTKFITSGFALIDISNIVNLSMTVTGANSGNGNFTKSDFGGIYFYSPTALNFSRELVGQVLTGGNKFGGENGTLNFAGMNSAPAASYYDDLSSAGLVMKLTSMSVAAVPEADTSAMLLMGAGMMGFIARRRKQVVA